jgi:hypothetical protein
MKLMIRLGTVATSIAMVAVGSAGGASATGTDPTFRCVSVNADSCTVTIPLTSDMNEQVGSSMPDSKPWSLNEANGQGPYGITGPGNPQTTWDGVPGALQGTVWTAILTTGDDEPAGSQAVLTFAHVSGSTTTTAASRPYASIDETYPLRVLDGATATITATVRPVPAKGHLVLLRKSGSRWVSVGALTHSTSSKKWSIKFKWRFPKRTSETFRLWATAAAGLTATYGGNFKISTLA